MKSTEDLVEALMSKIYTTKGLKEISDTLEHLSSDKAFKLHVSAIIDDTSLTQIQKRRQLNHILRIVDDAVLQDFFEAVISKNQFWLFTTGKIDYFDKFVQNFQMSTEELEVVYLVTAIELTPVQLQAIGKDLSRSFGYRVVIKHEINPNILGGVQLKVENLVFDYSLKTKFQQFQRTWLLSLSKTEKQIGRNQPSSN